MNHFTNNTQRKIGVMLGYVHMSLSAVISIIYIPILLNGLGKGEYGLYQLLGSVISYFSTMYSSFNSSVMKYYTQYLIDGDVKKMENTLAISRRIFIIISIMIVIISVPVVLVYRFIYKNTLTISELNESVWMFGIMIANILVNLNNTIYSASIMSHEKYIFRRSIDIFAQILQPIIVVFFIRQYPYALVIAIVQFILNIIIALINIFYAKIGLNIKIVYHGYDKSIIKGILSLFGSILFVSLADQIFWKTDQLFLGLMYGTSIVAIYSIGSQLNSLYISIGIAMSSVLLPMLTQIINKENNSDRLSKVFTQLGRYQSYIIMLVLSGVIIFGKEFIVIIAGEDFLPAYKVAMFLMIPYTVDLIQNSGNTILQAEGKYWYRAYILFFAAIINVFLTYFGIKSFGMYGAALATTVAIVISSWFIMNRIYSKKIGLDIMNFWKEVIPIWILGIVPLCFGIIISQVSLENRYIQFVFHISMYTLIYIIFIVCFVMKNNEKNFFFQKLSKQL